MPRIVERNEVDVAHAIMDEAPFGYNISKSSLWLYPIGGVASINYSLYYGSYTIAIINENRYICE